MSLRLTLRVRGQQCGLAKLSADEVQQIRRHRAAGRKLADLAFAHGVTPSNISAIARRRTWTP